MLIAFAPLLLLTTQAVEPPGHSELAQSETDSEILVTARRLSSFRGVVKTRRKTGELYCKIRRSSGDRAFDEQFCGEMLRCHTATSNSAAVRAVGDTKDGKRELERVWGTEAMTCMKPFFARFGIADG